MKGWQILQDRHCFSLMFWIFEVVTLANKMWDLAPPKAQGSQQPQESGRGDVILQIWKGGVSENNRCLYNLDPAMKDSSASFDPKTWQMLTASSMVAFSCSFIIFKRLMLSFDLRAKSNSRPNYISCVFAAVTFTNSFFQISWKNAGDLHTIALWVV